MKNIFAYFGVICFMIGICVILLSGSRLTNSFGAGDAPLNQTVTQPFIPSKIKFAGERVPLEKYDVKERLDRELISISYRHSSTIRIIKLANRWFPTIERILEKNNIPEDFKYLAVAESGLENVISPKEARGFWQFLRGTARSFGLEVDKDVDERYHVERATEAACKYLLQAHEKFGSWGIVAASYNMGMGGVNQQSTNQKTKNYYDLYLNSETSRYLFRIMAYKILLESPDKYGFQLEKRDLYQHIPHEIVKVGSIDNITSFARKHRSSYKEIKLLNPWLSKTSLSPRKGKSYEIKVPL